MASQVEFNIFVDLLTLQVEERSPAAYPALAGEYARTDRVRVPLPACYCCQQQTDASTRNMTDKPAPSPRLSNQRNGRLETTIDAPVRRNLVSNQILECSARLFAERGYAGTSLQDIADSMGISRPNLYTYVQNKEEILSALVEDVMERTKQVLIEAKSSEGNALDRLRTALVGLAVLNVTNGLRFKVLERSEGHLPPEMAAIHKRDSRAVLGLLVELVEAAADAGFTRAISSRQAALGLLGMVNWVVWWYRPEVDGPAKPNAELLVDMALNGLKKPQKRSGARDALGAIDAIKEELAVLEKVLDTPRKRTAAAAASARSPGARAKRRS